MVEFIGSERDLCLSDGIERHFLRKELPDEAVHVLVGAALPRGVRMGKEEAGSKFAGDTLMLCELFAVVGRQRVNAGGIWRQQGNHDVRYRLRSLARYVSDQRVTGLALVDRDECLMMARANDQIGLQSPNRSRVPTMAGRCSIDTWLGMVPRRSRPP